MIYGYSILPKTNKIFVYLRYYRNRPIIKDIRLYSKPGHKRYLNRYNSFKITKIINPSNVLLVGTSKTSTLEQLFISKYDKQYQLGNKHFGELLSMIW